MNEWKGRTGVPLKDMHSLNACLRISEKTEKKNHAILHKRACCFIHSRREKEDGGLRAEAIRRPGANERTRWQGTGTVEQMHSTTLLDSERYAGGRMARRVGGVVGSAVVVSPVSLYPRCCTYSPIERGSAVLVLRDELSVADTVSWSLGGT